MDEARSHTEQEMAIFLSRRNEARKALLGLLGVVGVLGGGAIYMVNASHAGRDAEGDELAVPQATKSQKSALQPPVSAQKLAVLPPPAAEKPAPQPAKAAEAPASPSSDDLSRILAQQNEQGVRDCFAHSKKAAKKGGKLVVEMALVAPHKVAKVNVISKVKDRAVVQCVTKRMQRAEVPRLTKSMKVQVPFAVKG